MITLHPNVFTQYVHSIFERQTCSIPAEESPLQMFLMFLSVVQHRQVEVSTLSQEVSTLSQEIKCVSQKALIIEFVSKHQAENKTCQKPAFLYPFASESTIIACFTAQP